MYSIAVARKSTSREQEDSREKAVPRNRQAVEAADARGYTTIATTEGHNNSGSGDYTTIMKFHWIGTAAAIEEMK